MDSFDWTCPYCNRAQAVTKHQRSQEAHEIYNSRSEFGNIGYVVETIRCANEGCRKLQLTFSLHRVEKVDIGKRVRIGERIRHWRLLPESYSKPQPDYIPPQLVEDYKEACRIRDLSPKASATLSRRCLQGMIRDFCGIQDKTLYREIERLRKQLDEGQGVLHVHRDSVDAIHHVRQIGNIGAHMEYDVNLIIDVEPNEAQVLIELIEVLFEEWYVQREERKQRFEAIQNIAERKENERKQEGEEASPKGKPT